MKGKFNTRKRNKIKLEAFEIQWVIEKFLMDRILTKN